MTKHQTALPWHWTILGMILACAIRAEGTGNPPSRVILRAITLNEPFGVNWPSQLVSKKFSFAPGECEPGTLALIDQENGRPVPFQLSDVRLHPGNRHIASCTLNWRSALPARRRKRWSLTSLGPGGRSPQFPSPFRLRRKVDRIELDNGRIAIAFPRSGKVRSGKIGSLATPVLGIKGPDRAWFGRGAWFGQYPAWKEMKITTRASGPVLAEIQVDYTTSSSHNYQVII